jgi:formylglycine-generating enzyme
MNARIVCLWSLSFAILISTAACTRDSGSKAISDCPGCPVMVEVPAGRFMMGTALEDRVDDAVSGKPNANEEPQHEVVIAAPFAIGKYEVTVAQFADFVADSGYVATRGCIVLREGPGRLTLNPELNWRNPGFTQASSEPVVCVSLDDAIAYTAWLSEKTGRIYFIPSEAQWEYAAKAGTTGRYYWSAAEQACYYTNVTYPREGAGAVPAGCDDGYTGLAPAGSFRPNAFGLHDSVGNAWEWTVDCNHKNYVGAPADGSAWIDEKDCLFRVIRGGGAGNDLARTTNVVRAGRPKTGTAPNLGFRLARELADDAVTKVVQPVVTPAPSAGSPWPAEGRGGELFAVHCAACHRDKSSYKGVYGTDAESIQVLIRDGGNNIMSMPAFGAVLSDEDIAVLTDYLRQQKGWN